VFTPHHPHGVGVVPTNPHHTPAGERKETLAVFQVIPGVSKDVAANKIRAYFERHPNMPCTWGRLTSGTCAPEESHIDMPGCRDQKSRICYELAKEEL
jgi:hypothetical protein